MTSDTRTGYDLPIVKKIVMFWFHHPRPFIQKAEVMQIVQRKAAAADDTSLIIVETAGGKTQATAAVPPQPDPAKA